MGKTKDLLKKIRNTKRAFHAKMAAIKDRSGKELTVAEEIKKRWKENTELYKKGLNDPDNHNGVITHLEPDILESKVKWVLGCITMNKGSGGDGIPVELFQILKDDAVKVLHSISSCGFTLHLIRLAFTGAGPSPPGLSQGKPLWMTHTIKFI